MIFENRFASALRKKLADELTAKHRELGSGTKIIANDAAATGMACARTVGEIAGLEIAIRMMDRVEEEMAKRKGE